MVVPPDFHDGQRLVTHKLRVSGCNVDTERSYDTFGNVVLDFRVRARRARRSSSPPGSWSSARRRVRRQRRPRAAAARRAPARALAADRARRRAARRRGRAARAGLAGRRARRARLGTASTTTSRYQLRRTDGRARTAAEALGRRRRRLPGLRALHARRSAGCAACRRATSPGHLLGEGGTHAWVEVLVPHPTERGRAARRADRPDARPPRGPELPHRRRRPRLRRRAADLGHLRGALRRAS